MTTSDSVYVHMGMARTGTTVLQTDYFSKAPELLYLGKNSKVPELDIANRLLTRTPYEMFDPRPVKAAFDAYRAGRSGVPIFSDEDLSIWKFLTPRELGLNIGDVFLYPHLIFVVRRPVDWVRSQFYFRLWTFRRDAIQGLNPYLEKHLSQLRVHSDLAEIQFTQTFEAFRKTSRAIDHLILPHELMVHQPREFLEQLESYLEAPAALTRIFDAGEPPPRKMRIDRRQAAYIRTLGFFRRDRERFLEIAQAYGRVGRREHREGFEALAVKQDATYEEWESWFRRGRRPVFAALKREDEALLKALPIFDDYKIRKGLLAHVLEVEQEETAAMHARFGVDLTPYRYGSAA